MTERTADILTAAVREFITLGEPISSRWLYERYDFGIKPATIRSELNELAERGFLEQPHHSAARVPADRGYEFFAERSLSQPAAAVPKAGLLERLFERGSWDEFLARLSRDLGVLGVASEQGEVLKEGLDILVDHLDWDSRDEIREVIRDFEEIDERLNCNESLSRNNSSDSDDFVEVFIGRKSLLTRSDHLSVMTGDYLVNGHRLTLVLVGPKRMNYEKGARVLHGLKHFSDHE